MMKIVYLSLTGNIKRFVEKTEMDSLELSYGSPFVEMNEPFVMVVPSYDGEITEFHRSFIGFMNNESLLLGVAGSGSLNFGDEYCFSAKQLAAEYGKPLISTFEMDGTAIDIIKFQKEVKRFEVS